MTTLRLNPHPVAPTFLLDGAFPQNITDVFGATLINGRWYFPAFRPLAQLVVTDLFKVIPRLELEVAAARHVTAMANYLDLPMDFEFITAPFEHQREGLQWAYNCPRAGLFFAPGLGKCKITVDLHRLTGDTMLIECPAVVLRTWAKEFKLHGHVEDVVVLDGDKKDKHKKVEDAVARMPAALVMTYETLTNLAIPLAAAKPGAMILDESHRIKSVSSARTKAALQVCGPIKRRVLLSGTPSLGTPFGLYPQLRFLGHYFAPENWTDFRLKFGIYDAGQIATKKLTRIEGYKNIDVIRERVTMVCVRKYLEDCVDLPERQIIDVPFELGPKETVYYDDLVVGSADEAGMEVEYRHTRALLGHADGAVLPTPYVWTPDTVSRLSKLEQVTSGFVRLSQRNTLICNGCEHLDACVKNATRPYTTRCPVVKKVPPAPVQELGKSRLEALRDLLEGILEEETNKVIIWTRFIHELDTVAALCRDLGVPYVQVQGGMSTAAFEAAKDRFNEDPACRVYAGQVASGIGVTLNAANYMIYYHLPWSLEQYDQSKARNYRIGQQRRVIIYRLLAQGTVDFDKAAALDQKVDIDAALTNIQEKQPCPQHDLKDKDAACICSSAVFRIVAKLATLMDKKQVQRRVEQRRAKFGLPAKPARRADDGMIVAGSDERAEETSAWAAFEDAESVEETLADW